MLKRKSFQNMNNWPIQSRLQAFFLAFLLIVSLLLVGTTLSAAFRHSNAQLEQRFDNTRKVLQYKFSNDGQALFNVINTASRNFSIKQLIASAKDDKESLLVALQNLKSRTNASFVKVSDTNFNRLAATREIHLPDNILPQDLINPEFIRLSDNNIYLVAAVAVKFIERQPTPNAWLIIGKNVTSLFDQEVKKLTAFDVFVVDKNNRFVGPANNPELTFALQTTDSKQFSTLELSEKNYLIKGYSLSDSEQSGASLFFATLDSSAHLNFQNLSTQLGLQILLAIGVAIVISITIARSISKPMKQIEHGAKKIQEGDYQTQFPKFSTPELNHLASAFDQMQVSINEREKEIQTLAYNNMITQLPNRNAYLKELDQVVVNGRFVQFAVAALDLDRFKVINDTIGHESGDSLLKAIGKRLASLDIENSFVSHTDGDEFAFILPYRDEPALKVVLEQITQVFDTPFIINEVYLDVNVSIGIACYPKHTKDIQKLMQFADIALYENKTSHKPIEIYRECFNHYSVQRLNLMSELRLAIEKNQLSLYYQPKLCLKNNKVISVESLVRWIHPEHGFIGPDEFIPLAEQTGAIRELTNWVVKEAISQQANLEAKGYDIQVSVNISAFDLVDYSLVTKVASLLREYNVKADKLKIEVTESAIMNDAKQAISTLNMLRDLGVTLSIDDFGTGYSSMSQLRDMPVDELKIDKSFVMDIPENSGNKKIVTSTVSLAHSLGLSVVAEGVETEACISFLKSINVELGQGYFIAKPLEAKAFEQWLSER